MLGPKALPGQQLKSKEWPKQEWEDPSARARDENSGSHPRAPGRVTNLRCNLPMVPGHWAGFTIMAAEDPWY